MVDLVRKNKAIYRAAATGRYSSADNGTTVLSKTIPAGTYKFTLSGFFTYAASSNCALTMQKDSATFFPLGGSDFENRAHLSQNTSATASNAAQTLTFLYTNPSSAVFRFLISITGSSFIGNASWTAELIDNESFV